MPKYKDLSGMRFGRLTVEEQAGRSKDGRVLWRCSCDCGKEKITESTSLIRGITKSCGCLAIEPIKKISTKHGKSGERIYTIWREIKSRCNKTNDKSYKHYGGRGIKMCDEWYNSFDVFYDWATNNGYSENLTIDRIDNDGNYCPENCRWATVKEQSNNRRTNRNITYNGETHTVSEWATLFGKDYGTILARLNRGWSIGDALNREIDKKYLDRRKNNIEMKTE